MRTPVKPPPRAAIVRCTYGLRWVRGLDGVLEVLRTDKVLSADATELITDVLLEGRG